MPLNPFAPVTEKVADGVWRHAGDLRHGMNIYLIEDGDGVTAFEAGTRAMTDGLLAAAERLGGLKRIVLSHSHADHRGAAPGADVPVLCHVDEVSDAEGDGGCHYFDLDKIPVWYSRRLYPWLFERWDGGPVEIADTVVEGDRIGEFEVLHFPGHAPGLIALWRERDRLVLASDVIYLIDSMRLRPVEEPRVPHPVWNFDHAAAIDSVRRLAALEPRILCAGHNEPLVGEPAHIRQQLEWAADHAEPSL